MPITKIDDALERIAKPNLSDQDVRELVVWVVTQLAEHRRGFHKTSLLVQALFLGLKLTLDVIDRHGLAKDPDLVKALQEVDKAVNDAGQMFK